VAWVLLLYVGNMGSSPLQRRGCSVLIGTVAHGRGRRDLKGGPILHMTRASMMVSGVLHPRQLRVVSSFLRYDRWRPDLEQQAAAYTRGRSMTVGSDLGPAGLDLGFGIFFIIEH
jgi:hypothetical protein